MYLVYFFFLWGVSVCWVCQPTGRLAWILLLLLVLLLVFLVHYYCSLAIIIVDDGPLYRASRVGSAGVNDG